MLLEVVIALGLLILGMAVVGAQIRDSAIRARQTDQTARVAFLAESKIAELDAGLIIPEQEIEKDFGPLFPRYGWRMHITPANEPDLNLIELEILYDEHRESYHESVFDFENALVMNNFYTLRFTPRPLNLTTDFGLDEDKADEINQDLAGVGDGMLDVRQFDPSLFRDLSLDQIVQLMPTLMQAFNIEQSALMNMVPPELRSQLEQLLSEFQDDGSLPDGDDLPDGVSDALDDLTGGGEQGSGDRGDRPSDGQDAAGEGQDKDPGGDAGERGNRRNPQRGSRDRRPGGGS